MQGIKTLVRINAASDFNPEVSAVLNEEYRPCLSSEKFASLLRCLKSLVRATFATSGLSVDGLGIHEEFVKRFNQSAIGTGFDVLFLVLKIFR